VVLIIECLYAAWAGSWWLTPGADAIGYLERARVWLDGGSFYIPFQLEGPYPVNIVGGALYPPPILYLLVPLTFLPLWAFWAIPFAITGWALWRMRPSGWLLMALCLAWPMSLYKIIEGNPLMWAVAAESLALLYRWPGPFVLFKPSLAPFALTGIRTRGWWVAAGVLALACIPFGAMWGQWVTAIVNAEGTGGALYSLQEWPLMCLPLVAWLTRTERSSPGPG